MNPALACFGSAEVICPDGAIGLDLWPELAQLVLLEPDPELRAEWVRRLETKLGVRDIHRTFVAGGEAAVRSSIRADQIARGLVIDEFSRVDPSTPFPGEAPADPGHSLAEPEDKDARRVVARLNTIRPEDASLAWYVFRAATRQEARAEANLINNGYAVYVPRITCWRRAGRLKVRAERALFGGYLFVGLNAKQAIGDAIELDGVHNVIRFNGYARQVAFSPIAALVAQEVEGEFDKTRRDRRRDPPKGAPVDVIGGMFKGWPAKFVERRDDERISLMLTMFGKDTPYSVDADDVQLPEQTGDKSPESR